MITPRPINTETALRIYYTYPREIGNAEIKELFGVKSSASVSSIKKHVRELMEEKGVTTWNKNSIDTRTTYEYAGIDIDRIERCYLKMKKLGMM